MHTIRFEDDLLTWERVVGPSIDFEMFLLGVYVRKASSFVIIDMRWDTQVNDNKTLAWMPTKLLLMANIIDDRPLGNKKYGPVSIYVHVSYDVLWDVALNLVTDHGGEYKDLWYFY